MTEKELKKLSRLDLVELLLEAAEENERLKQALEATEQKLARRELICNEAGNLAQAALQVNEIFEAAQQAADDFLANLKRMAGQAPAESSKDSDSFHEEGAEMV